MWVIKKIVKKGDYKYAVVHNHPNAIKFGYVLLHRVIMENHIGRLLLKDEIIHHKDGNKNNNDISNLEILSKSNHTKLHASKVGRQMALLKCPNCNIIFERQKNQTHFFKGTDFSICSRKCNGELSRKRELSKISKEEIIRLKKNNLIMFFTKYGDEA